MWPCPGAALAAVSDPGGGAGSVAQLPRLASPGSGVWGDQDTERREVPVPVIAGFLWAYYCQLPTPFKNRLQVRNWGGGGD